MHNRPCGSRVVPAWFPVLCGCYYLFPLSITRPRLQFPCQRVSKHSLIRPMSSSNPRRLTDEDKVIAVMGVTGSGKSTFIEKATQQDGRTVGHRLRSFTSEVRAVRVTYDQVSVVFVDTPGFDDTTMSDTEVLGIIAGWLRSAYKSGKKLTGLLYFHRITDDRMYRSAVRNLDVFERLCGEKAMSRVVFVTTMWDQVSREVGEEREKELKGNYWNSMLIAGSCTQRFKKTFKSAWEIVHRLPAFHQSAPPSTVQIQDEMVSKRYKLEETLAAKTLHRALEKSLKDKKAASKRLKEQAGRQGNEVLVQQLNERKQETDAKVQDIFAQVKQLNPNVSQSACNSFPQSTSNCHQAGDPMEDRVIAVMGVPGSGKSTFVESATQQDGKTVGHKLRPSTLEVRAVRITYNRVPIVFVDTPGFDDEKISETEILGVIAEWLQSRYNSGKKLTGLLYFHRITDNRMYGSALRKLDVFEQLCGENTISRVIFVTTMWDQVPHKVGEDREKELMDEYWNSMPIARCCTRRFEKTFKSAWEIVRCFPAFQQSSPPSLADAVQIQVEVVKRYELEEIRGAGTQHAALQKLRKDNEVASKRPKEQRGKQGTEVQQLNRRKQETDARVQDILAQLKQLNLTVPQRLKLLFKLLF